MSTNDTRRVLPRFGRSRALAWSGLLVAGLLAVPVLAGGTGPVSDVDAAASCPAATYTVVKGDSWSRIASRSGVTMSALLQANNATATKVIHPGNVLCLPAGATSTVSSTTIAPTPTLPTGATIAQFPVQGLCWFADSFGAPRSGGRRHEGVDILAAQGNKVYAVTDGVLTKQYLDAPGSLSGNGWRLTKPDGTYFFYAHLSAFAPGLSVGSTVKAGQILGQVGMTGNAGSPHLHFEVHPGGGAAINPTPSVTAVNGCTTTKIPPQPGDPSSGTPTTVAPPATVNAPTPTTTTTVPPLNVEGGLWQFIVPAEAFNGTLPAGQSTVLDVGKLPGVGAGTPGVMVRAVVDNAAFGGYLVLYSCATGKPPTSNLNYAAGRLNATMALVGVSAGQLCVFTTSSVRARIEVVGYAGPVGVGVMPMTSRRAVDTRETGVRLSAKPTVLNPTALGAPRGAKAVTVSVTLLAPSGAGQLSLGPCNGTPWTLAYTSASAHLLSAIVRIDDAGLCVSTTSEVHAVIDVTGAWTGSEPLGVVTPTRVLDTRTGSILGLSARTVAVPLPAGAGRTQFTLTLVGGTSGALFAWNCAEPKPIASVGYTNGDTLAVTVTMNMRGGQLCLAGNSPIHVIVDLTAVG